MVRSEPKTLALLLMSIVVGFLEPRVAAGQRGGVPTGRDFEVIQVPTRRNMPCTPVFFCRTRPTSARGAPADFAPATRGFTERRQVRWCERYAASVLGGNVAAQQLVLVQIDAAVGLNRLRQIAPRIAQGAECSRDWLPRPAPLMVSKQFIKTLREEFPERWGNPKKHGSPLAEILEVPALQEEEEDPERPLVLLQAPTEPTDPVAAARGGPDYTDPSNTIDLSEVPSERYCQCLDILRQAEACPCQGTSCNAE